MALTNPKNVVTEERLNEYHRTILPYLGGNSMVACGGGYAPIGTVIAYMGTRAPSDFLICDGTVYNIADYTELANFFELQFGSTSYFGGDGTTTFAVPDLRGEFLRGTGTNSHTNQGSGANVGVHQDGTEHLHIERYNNHVVLASDNTSVPLNKDSIRDVSSYVDVSGTTVTKSVSANYTSRPTNTSVLYCIKAKSQGNGYSLDEQIVGTWIDGKPIYQKSLQFSSLSIGVNTVIHDISNLDKVISCNGNAMREYDNSRMQIPTIYPPNISAWSISITKVDSTNIDLWVGSNFKDAYTLSDIVVTLQYTKTTD